MACLALAMAVAMAGAAAVAAADESPRKSLSGRYTAEQLRPWETPLQVRDPQAAWRGQPVFQKRGIVMEEKEGDIVYQGYWVLDRSAIGVVEEVRLSPKMPKLVVRFPNRNGWERRVLEIQRETTDTTQTRMSIRPSYAGDGAEIEKDEVTVRYEKVGMKVDPAVAGHIIGEEGDSTVVELPMNLVGRARPLVGSRVIRGPDWCDGFADGGSVPFGPNPKPLAFTGEVVEERDVNGCVTVRWEQTGRVTAHRYDVSGFYDLQPLPGDAAAGGQPAPGQEPAADERPAAAGN